MKMINSSAIKNIIPSASRYFLVTCALFFPHAAFSMVELGDEKLSQVTGQALLQMGKTNPGEDGTDINGPTFYKAGLDAELELNMNIEKLQLGCGGVNGPGCDIDIDNLSLSGDCGNRPTCSAALTRPFFEFAIENDDDKTLRQVTGVRISSERANGLLTMGKENSTVPNGINKFSGYMQVQSDNTGQIYGQAHTSSAFFDAGAYPVEGRMEVFGSSWLWAEFRTIGGGFNIPAMAGLPFAADAITVNESRITNLPIETRISVPSIYVGPDNPQGGQIVGSGESQYVETRGGPVDAIVTDHSFLAGVVVSDGDTFTNIDMEGSIAGMEADVTINQGLGYIHKLPVDSPFYLSFQEKSVDWPGGAPDDVARTGWWMSFADPVNLGSVDPVKAIDVTELFPQIATQVGAYLNNSPANTNDLGGVLSGDGLDVGIGNVVVDDPLSLTLTDLQISGQNFSPNCYGTARFC